MQATHSRFTAHWRRGQGGPPCTGWEVQAPPPLPSPRRTDRLIDKTCSLTSMPHDLLDMPGREIARVKDAQVRRHSRRRVASGEPYPAEAAWGGRNRPSATRWPGRGGHSALAHELTARRRQVRRGRCCPSRDRPGNTAAHSRMLSCPRSMTGTVDCTYNASATSPSSLLKPPVFTETDSAFSTESPKTQPTQRPWPQRP